MTSEAAVQNHVRLNIANGGGVVWRNNVGACKDEAGRMIRYGLCNESKQLNERIKSSDLIGIVPVLIQPHHVGRVMGIFTAIECKAPDWRMTPSDSRAEAQARFHKIVKDIGGYAGFVRNQTEMWELLK